MYAGVFLMNKKKLFLIAVSAAAIALAVMLAAGAVVLFLNGSARKAENPMEQIYTREQAANALAAVAPFFVLFAGLSAAGVILGIKDENRGKQKTTVRRMDKPKHKGLIQAAMAVAAAALIVAGIINGSALDVLIKAITICSECIGLG